MSGRLTTGEPLEDGSALSTNEIQFLIGLSTAVDRPPMVQILSGCPITTEGWDVPIYTLLEASAAQKRSGSLAAKFLEFMRERRSKCKAKLGTAPVDWEVTRDCLLGRGRSEGASRTTFSASGPRTRATTNSAARGSMPTAPW